MSDEASGMSSDTPAHDFLLPRLSELVRQAERGGIARDVAVAVLTDLITGPQFNGAVPDADADSRQAPSREPDPTDATLLLRQKHELIDRVVQPRGIV